MLRSGADAGEGRAALSPEPSVGEARQARSGSAPTLGAVCGLAAAALFGVSPALIKRGAPEVSALWASALLYGGAAAAVWLAGWVVAGVRRRRPPGERGAGPEAALRCADLGLLAGVVLAGGVAGPVLLLLALARVSATSAALLLNLEAVATIAIAVGAFGEHLARRELGAAGIILLGAGLLTVPAGTLHFDPAGAGLIALACAAWGLDNNLSQRLSVRSPVQLVRVKALAAAGINAVLAAALGSALPSARSCAVLLGVGAASYGLSIVLDVYALRLVGAAREAAYFATAPFMGALAGMALLGERVGPLQLVAMAVLGAGVALLIRTRHGPVHAERAGGRGPLVHSHPHVHDADHQHPHDHPVDRSRPHTHPHAHASWTHDHPHPVDGHRG